MGTLITDDRKSRTTKPKRNKASSVDVVEDKEIAKLHKRIEKDYSKLRYEMEKLRQAFDSVDSAKSTDDINLRLKNLEKASKRLRKGSMMFKGAKHHAKLLKKLQKISVG